jgi:hypothetical protein
MQNSFTTSAKHNMSVFAKIGSFARKTRTVRLAQPDDILSDEPVWSDEQLGLPLSQRGQPQRMKLEIRPGAETLDVEIRPLSMTERESAEHILDAALPPQTFVEEQPVRPGDIPKKIPSGFDYEDPKYLADLRPLQERQAAFVALKGVIGLHESTTGNSVDEKLKALMDEMPSRIIRFLASEIWAMTYAQGSPADFFTKEDSSSSPSSEPSPKQSQGEPKPKS